MDHSLPQPHERPRAGAGGPGDTAGVLVARGPRAAETVLLEMLDGVLPNASDAASLAALARPVRVVVPSASLRRHVSARLVRRRGAVVGVQVQTLFSTAREILARCGEAPSWQRLPGDLAFEVLVRRLARGEPELSRGLDFLVDGYGAVAGTVRDLLDAGLEPFHADAADESLAAALEHDPPVSTTAAEVARARALVRVAARVEAEMEARGVVRRATLLARATHLLAADPARALPSRAVFVHGFADATGIAAELVEALLRHAGARLILDTPPDPAAAQGDDAERSAGAVEDAFPQRFRERLSGAAGEAATEPAAGPPAAAAVDRFQAPGGDAEARQVAVRLRALLDAGAVAEELGVVARDLEPHRIALRHHLDALGVPFSGVGAAGSLTAAGRRIQGLMELLARRDELPADRWLDAVAALPWLDGTDAAVDGGRRWRGGPFVDLRLALSAVGAARLRDVAALDLDRLLQGRPSLPLPARQGLSYGPAEESGGAAADREGGGGPEDGAPDEEGDDGSDGAGDDSPGGPRRQAVARRRHVPRQALAGAVAAAASLLRRLGDWPARAPAAVHLARLRRLLTRDLRWRPRSDPHRSLFDTLDALEADLPPSLDLDFQELRLLLARALDGQGRTPLGGAGGGVQVLTVTEARGRTFEHLFVVGVNRGVFPRSVRPDPLLPDELRGVLAAVLPDVPRKKRSFDEERYLFAQLATAAPRVTLSWRSRDDDGQPLSPSPLVERLPGEPAAKVAAAPAVYAPSRGAAAAAGTLPRPAREEAVLASLAGAPRSAVEPIFAHAVAETRRELPAPLLPLDARDVAAARRAVLDEMDPDTERAHRLGPYFGFLGAVRPGVDDPRRGDPWLTHLENLAACPWQLFLRRILRLEPTPDPISALPGLDALLLGNVVHRVLEAIAEAAGAAARLPLAELEDAPSTAVPWPPPAQLETLLRRTSLAVLAEEGMLLPGLARALAQRARPFLERARDEDWADGPLPVLAAEVVGEVAVTDAADQSRQLRFRADRADAAGDGLRLTDYKTGRPLSEAKRESTRRRHHLEGVAKGTRLQATAYALAAGAAGSGRYLYLRPDADQAEVAVAAGDAAFADAFTAAAATALAAWDAGALFPRLEHAASQREPSRCQWCEVSEACLRLDSGARLRLRRWVQEGEQSGGSEAERALRALWDLDAGVADDGPEGDR